VRNAVADLLEAGGETEACKSICSCAADVGEITTDDQQVRGRILKHAVLTVTGYGDGEASRIEHGERADRSVSIANGGPDIPPVHRIEDPGGQILEYDRIAKGVVADD